MLEPLVQVCLKVNINLKLVHFLKTHKISCNLCRGTGTVDFMKKDGTYGMPRKCKKCFGKGVVYMNTKEKAGLGLNPLNEKDLSSADAKFIVYLHTIYLIMAKLIHVLSVCSFP